VYGANPRHRRGRRKLGGKILTYLYTEVLSSSYLETQLEYLLFILTFNSLSDYELSKLYQDDVGTVNPGGTVRTGTGTTRVTSRNNGIPVSIRAVPNLNLGVYYLKHMESVQRQPVPNAINLLLVCSYRDQQHHEVGFKKTDKEPEINDKD
jgi:hypothetical protein